MTTRPTSRGVCHMNRFWRKEKKLEDDIKINRTADQYSRSKRTVFEAYSLKRLFSEDIQRNHYAEMVRRALLPKR